MAQTFLFYIFSVILLTSAALVVTIRNPVHAVLFLILAFLNAAGLFLLVGAELLSMILVIVYVGAVAVLFLFVIMMLDIDYRELQQGFTRYAILGGLVGGILATEMVIAAILWIPSPKAPDLIAHSVAAEKTSNAHALGSLLYTDYAYLFQLSGLILLVAMIGAIVLTMRERQGIKKQDISKQLQRTRINSLEIRQVSPGQGVEG